MLIYTIKWGSPDLLGNVLNTRKVFFNNFLTIQDCQRYKMLPSDHHISIAFRVKIQATRLHLPKGERGERYPRQHQGEGRSRQSVLVSLLEWIRFPGEGEKYPGDRGDPGGGVLEKSLPSPAALSD